MENSHYRGPSALPAQLPCLRAARERRSTESLFHVHSGHRPTATHTQPQLFLFHTHCLSFSAPDTLWPAFPLTEAATPLVSVLDFHAACSSPSGVVAYTFPTFQKMLVFSPSPLDIPDPELMLGSSPAAPPSGAEAARTLKQ